MNSAARFLALLLIIVFLSTAPFDMEKLFVTKQSENQTSFLMLKAQGQNIVTVESDQSFSGAAGSIIEYNIYVENKGKSTATYTLSALSSRGYYLEIWRETNQIGSGDLKLIPPQDSPITLKPGEIAVLVVRVTVPQDAPDGTVENTIIKAVNKDFGMSDSATITTNVDSNLEYPSNWIQVGSDSSFPTSPSKIDVKAFYYTNNGTNVFFRMVEASKPDAKAFLYLVYLDTTVGGQQIGSYAYDYLISSDGILYTWNGTGWVNSGYPTYWCVDGTSVVLSAKFDNLRIDIQEIHLLVQTATKDRVLKDAVGPYTILRSDISEIPLILIPILSLIVCFSILTINMKKEPTR